MSSRLGLAKRLHYVELIGECIVRPSYIIFECIKYKINNIKI